MKKSAILLVVLMIAAALTLPLTAACNDCDENGFPESILPCNNRSIRAKSVEPAQPVNLDADGEPQLDAAEMPPAETPAESSR